MSAKNSSSILAGWGVLIVPALQRGGRLQGKGQSGLNIEASLLPPPYLYQLYIGTKSV